MICDFKKCKSAVCFVGGLVFGTAGLKLLSSKDAKNAYVHTVAAGLRMKECVLDTVEKVQENAEDVLAAAKAVNEARAAKEAEAAEAAVVEEACEAEKEDEQA